MALRNALLRPYPSEVKTPMMAVAFLENSVICLILLLCLIHCLPFASIRWDLFLFCFSFVTIQLLIIGETTPVIGALARYKVPALPFLVIAFLSVLDKNKLKKRFSWLARK